jgi:hypothetical protein
MPVREAWVHPVDCSPPKSPSLNSNIRFKGPLCGGRVINLQPPSCSTSVHRVKTACSTVATTEKTTRLNALGHRHSMKSSAKHPNINPQRQQSSLPPASSEDGKRRCPSPASEFRRFEDPRCQLSLTPKVVKVALDSKQG